MTPAIAIKITYSQPIRLYEDAVHQMGFDSGEHTAPGNLFHWVEETDDGFVVHDVWTDEAAFNAFREGTLAQLGMPEPVKVEATPVYNYLVGADAD